MSDDTAQPRLYLIAPAEVTRRALSDALQAGDIACVLLRGAGEASRGLVRAAQDRDVAVLVADDALLGRKLEADGVHLGPDGDVASARRTLGEESIVGVSCGGSRHAAMLAGEAGADYVAFAGTADDPEAAAASDILAWWQVMMTVPCVAMGRVGLDDVQPLAEAGADFVALEEAVWSHPEGPAAAVGKATRALQRVERR